MSIRPVLLYVLLTLGSTVDAPFAQPAAPDLVVNEIMYAPPDPAAEYVELYNRSPHAVDLAALQLADNRMVPVPIGGATVLVPGDYAVLVRDRAAFEAAFPGVEAVEVNGWPVLNNGGDAVVLVGPEGVVDSVAYAAGWGGSGVALERHDPAGPSSAAVNWSPATGPRGGTPGARNSVYAPDRSPPLVRLAEVQPGAAVEVTFNEPVDTVALRPDAFQLGDGRGPADLAASDGGLRVRLQFDETPSGTHLTVRGVRDLTGNRLDETAVLIAYPPGPGDLRISEIMFAPRADRFDDRPDQPEYIEVANPTTRGRTLRGLYRTGPLDEHGRSDTVSFGAHLAALPPHRFAVVFAASALTGEERPEALLARAFPEMDTTEAVLLPVARASLRLRNDGDVVRLHRTDGTVLDAVSYAPAWHHPSLVDPTGTSIERILLDGPSTDPDNWTSSVSPAGGTPGRPNSVTVPEGASRTPSGLTVAPSPFSPDGDGWEDVASLRYRLRQAPALLRVRIYDARGRLVRTLEDAALSGTEGALLWDGLDDAGRALRVGIYVALLEAVDPGGGTVEAYKAPIVLARPLK